MIPEAPVAEGRPTSAPARHGRHLAVRIPTLVIGALLTIFLLGSATFAVANVLVRTTEREDRPLDANFGQLLH